MVTRSTRKATITTTPAVETIATESVAPEGFTQADFEAALAGLPSWKRFITATVLALLTYGFIGASLLVGLEALFTLSFMMALPAFLATMIYIIGACISFYIAYRFSKAVATNIMDATVDHYALSAKDKVLGAWQSVTSVFSAKPALQGA